MRLLRVSMAQAVRGGKMNRLEIVKRSELTDSQLVTLRLLAQGASRVEMTQKINSLSIFKGLTARGEGRAVICKGSKIVAYYG